MKKIIYILVVLFPCFSFAENNFFLDVSPNHPNFFAIYELQKKEIIQGFDNNEFRPQNPIVRAAATKVILLSAGIKIPKSTDESVFPDVPNDEWFSALAEIAKNKGIIKGDANGNFLPFQNVSRAEALAMIFRSAELDLEKPSKDPFSDVKIDDWYSEYFAAAKEYNLITSDLANPNEFLSRGELCELTFRFFKKNWEKSELRGLASFYSQALEGNKTSSGEKFSNAEFTAAHRTLEFGTKIRVTNTENLKSVIVRINDRGPFVDNRVIDLSRAAFGKIANFSSGLTPVILEVLPETTKVGEPEECEKISLQKNVDKISKNRFENIELFDELPKIFRQNEIFWIEGKVSKSVNEKFITAFFGPPENQHRYSVNVFDNKKFLLPVFFDEVGEFNFSIIPGKSGTGIVEKISVIKSSCEEKIDKISSKPQNLNFKISDGNAEFFWVDTENNFWRIEIWQENKNLVFFVNGQSRFSPPPKSFNNFFEGRAVFKIWGTKIDDNSFDRKTSWQIGEEKEFFLTQHFSGNRDTEKIPKIKISPDFSIGKNISVIGEKKENLKLREEIIITDPDEEILEIPLIIKENNLVANFRPEKLGNYLLEINEENGPAVLIHPIYPIGLVPVLPDFFDLRGEENLNLEKLNAENSEVQSKIMLKLVNAARRVKNVEKLETDENLQNLAQFRADDMCKRNFYSHQDPDGKFADDYRSIFNVQTNIGENFALERSVQHAHEGLLQSPAHRKNILSTNWTRVGFGFCQNKEETLVVVQIFGSDPFEPEKIPEIREEILSKISEVRISDPILTKIDLQNLAQSLSEKMVKENFFGFSKNKNDTFGNLIEDSGINGNFKAMIFQISSVPEFISKLDKEKIEIGDIAQENFLLDNKFKNVGIGISQDSSWNIFLVLLALGQ